jgi:hypothetical protein
MVTQLRIYTINKGKLDEFVKAWFKGVYPLRLKLGFKVDGAWTVKATNQFVWILRHDGPEDWQTKQEDYYNSPERKALTPDPVQLIARIEEFFITSVGT